MWNRKKLIRLITAAFIILFMMTVITGPKTQAASLTARNNKAHRVLKKKYNSIYRKHMDITYKYYDVTGDGIHELLMDCYPSSSGGSGHVIYIFQAKGSKAKCILKTTEYGLERISFYKKSKSLVMSMYGHGGESHSYYKFKTGKYKCLGTKSRQSVKGGNLNNGPWYYYNGSGKNTSKAAFTKTIKGLEKGKAKFTKTSSWKYVSNPDFTW